MSYLYFDNQATTPIDGKVLHLMQDVQQNYFGNPSSNHDYGKKSEQIVDIARTHIENIICAKNGSVYFTSGATESLNWVIKSLWEFAAPNQKILSVNIEHKATLETLNYIRSKGCKVEFQKVNSTGLLDYENLEKKLKKHTFAFIVSHVNNEIGTINDIELIASMCKKYNVLLIVDAAQSFGKINIDAESIGIDFLIASGHKIYGPKGVGMLYVNNRSKKYLIPLIHGGGQENGMRSGTCNVAGIAGFGEAARIAKIEMNTDQERIAQMKDFFLVNLLDLEGITLNGCSINRIYNNINVQVKGLPNEILLQSVSHLMAISGTSACNAINGKPSHVLQAIGCTKTETNTSIRISLGRFNTWDEVYQGVGLLKKEIINIRKILYS